MGRKLEFSKEKALHTAMESFWAHGYEQTSMRDLAQQLGLHLGSVYNALGDKERVFEAALKLNLEEVVLPRLRALETAEDPLKALGDFMTHTAEECTGDRPAPGCFLVNSLLEIADINDNITKTMHGYLAQIEDIFVHCVERAQKAGQVPADRDPRKYGQFVMHTLLAMRAMAKLKLPKEAIRNMRDCAFEALAA
jgi:TetR/AcrR family transcriptional regulator, transcriptional repressor for nem operon